LDKVKRTEYNHKYYIAHCEEEKARGYRYREEHREEVNKKRREHYALHPEDKEYARNWKNKHKERRNKERRALNYKYRVEALTHYGGGKLACVRCSESDIRCLSIDHINGGGYQHRQKLGGSGVNMARILRREGFPKGYQTLCMNCQFKKRIENHEVGYG